MHADGPRTLQGTRLLRKPIEGIGGCCALAPSGPACCCAAEQRDELAPFQLIEAHSIPPQQGQIAGYPISTDQSAGTPARVRFTSVNRRTPQCVVCRMGATTGLMQRSKRGARVSLFDDLVGK
jgi:hypothetical protein